MQRRQWLRLGAGAAVVFATAGGIATLVRPGLAGDKLSAGSRDVFARSGEAILDHSLPRGPARASALTALVQRIEALVADLPDHAKGELSQLLSLLDTTPGRLAVAGLRADWPSATVAELQNALQDMRTSRSSLRRQAYQALHDIAGAAYFADSSTWHLLGYPGPREVG